MWRRSRPVLRAKGLSGREIAAVISRELGAMTHRAAVLAEQRMGEAGRGAPPCPYAFAVLGSAGRGESLLAMDQDNAIVFAEGEPDGPEDRWFAALGAHVADILHEAGVPYCAGGVMARNAPWRGSLATWRARVRDWIRRSNPQDLLSVDIFFDLRGVHGDAALAATLWREGFDLAAGEVAFAKLLAETAGTVAPALNWFGGFKTAGWPHRPEEIRPVRHRLDGTRARDPPSCGGAFDRRAARRRQGARARRESDLEALIDAQATFPRPHSGPADPRHRATEFRRATPSRSSACRAASASGCVPRSRRSRISTH